MDKELKILILENVATDAELTERELRKGGLAFVSKRVETKEAFLKELKDFTPDIILADYSLPTFDGLSALSIAQEQCPDVPFILVSGAIGEESATEILKKGATDYVLKNNLSRLVPTVIRALSEAEEHTERKRAEEALAKALNEQKNIMDTIPDIIYLLDLEGKLVKWNRIGEIVTGFSSEEIKGKYVLNFFHDKDKPVVINAIQEVFEKGYKDMEAGLLLKDGTVVPYHWTGVPLKDEQGKAIGLIGVGRDITGRRKAEEDLWDIQERYRALVDNSVLGIAVMDTNYRIIMVNETFAKLFKKSASNFVGKYCFREFEKHEAVCPHCSGKRAMVSGKTEDVETQGMRDDGSSFYAHNRAVPFFGSDGVLRGFIEMVEDISTRKKAEEKIFRSEVELKKRVKELEEFYNMSIGRELRMIELKKEIVSLKEELARYKKDA